MKKLFQIFLDILIVLLCFIILIKVYGNFNGKDGYPDYFGYTYFEIISGSMEDTINIGDYVFVKLSNSDIKENDVISFKYDGVIVTHRVVKIDNDRLITKGDNNNTEDEEISINDVIGKVIYIGKGYANIVNSLTNPIVVLPVIVILFIINIFLSREVKIDEEKKK